jgi:S-formylglutathione hydrolase FrmB
MKTRDNRRRALLSLVLASTIAALAASCAGAAPQAASAPADQPPPPPYIVKTLAFKSELVKAGKIPESGSLTLQVLLPASYEASPETRYPVVYCFHGYGDSPAQLINASKRSLRALWPGKKAPEFIMVGIPGGNSLGGSFYVDSPATGKWRSMVADEVVPLVDSSYRTIADRKSRVVAGFSMGGFGAWSMGLARPDVFAYAWACCPGALAPGGLDLALTQWDTGFYRSYGAAFAPDLSLESPYSRAPASAEADPDLYKAWYAGFGDIEGKLKSYLAGKERLSAIRIDYGEADGYAWIPTGARYVAEAMKAAGLPVAIQGWSTTAHSPSSEIIEGGLMPFLAAAFSPR